MRGDLPEEPLDGFPTPPREVTDRKGREIELRQAKESDTESLVEMYLDFTPEDRAQGIPPTNEDAIRTWLDIVTTDRSLNVIAWHGERAVGHVMLVSDDTGAYELAIFVIQAYQGAHIGTELVRTALGVAQQRGIEYVWLSVERWNTPAVRLYEKIGFETTESERFEREMALRLA